jgi:TonB-linked SusC/RagA family outer membrane protein
MINSIIKKVSWIVSFMFVILFSLSINVSAENNLQSQQQQSLKGKVSDIKGTPLPGVNAVIKGTTMGTITDVDGNFSIPLSNKNTTLVFSFIGYLTKEVPISDLQFLNVTLAEDVLSLEEVVVVGYGTQKKRDLTGSVGYVSTKAIENNAVSGIGQALQGKLAGVEVSQTSGDPRAGVSINIRGLGTFGASSSPLIVVDGMITNEGLTDINPSSIEDIVVLKDASSAAIYGSRGANGVVLVSTKRGTSDRQNVQFSTYYSIDNVQRINTPVDAKTYATMMNEYFVNGGAAAPFTDAEIASFTKSTNWQNDIFHTGSKQNYELSVTGGTKKNTYALSVGYYKGEGIVVNDKYDRYNIRLNNDITPFERMKIGTSIGLSYGTVNQGDPTGAINEAMIYPPCVPAYLPNGNFGIADHIGEPVTMSSPLVNALMPQNKSIYTRALISTFAEYEIIKGLKFKTSVGVEFYGTDLTNFNPTYDYGTSNNNLVASLTRQSNTDKNLQWDNILTYSKTINVKHSINLLAGYTFQTDRYENFSGFRQSFASNDPSLQILDAGSENDQTRGNYSVWALQSYLGRLNYSYMSKYLFTSNIRIDQSSRFPAANRTGVFPSFSLGWVLSEEDFLKGNLGPVSFLKLRGGYGLLGNQDIGNYPYQSTLSSNAYYSFGAGSAGTVVVGTAPTSNVNSNISWEKTATSNIGAEVRFLNDKLNFVADYYNKITSDVLVSVPLPALSGLSGNPYQNVGSVRNRGVEFTLAYGNMNEKKDFTYQVGLNLTSNRNEVIKLSTDATIITQGGVQSQWEAHTEQGHQINEFYGYVADGIFQTTDEIANSPTQPNAAPGDIKYKDLNGDGVINSLDRKYIGSSLAQEMLGLNATVKYKNFDLSMNLNGEFGRSMYIMTAGFNLVRMGEITSAMYNDRWTGPGTSNYVPRLVAGDPNDNERMSTFWLRSQNFLRIQNIQFGYNFPANIISKIKMQSLRVYVAAQNLYTFDSFPGYDPELAADTYPIPRSIYFGINVGF